MENKRYRVDIETDLNIVELQQILEKFSDHMASVHDITFFDLECIN